MSDVNCRICGRLLDALPHYEALREHRDCFAQGLAAAERYRLQRASDIALGRVPMPAKDFRYTLIPPPIPARGVA